MVMAYYRARPDYPPVAFHTLREAMSWASQCGLTGCMWYVSCYLPK